MPINSATRVLCVGGDTRHGAVIEGESPLWDLAEVTRSEKQLHELPSAIEVADVVLP